MARRTYKCYTPVLRTELARRKACALAMNHGMLGSTGLPQTCMGPCSWDVGGRIEQVRTIPILRQSIGGALHAMPTWPP